MAETSASGRIRLYLPGHENIAFFRRFLRDFMALYKFNKVIMEVNASMRLDRHPELNAGWIDFARDLYYTQRYYSARRHAEPTRTRRITTPPTARSWRRTRWPIWSATRTRSTSK